MSTFIPLDVLDLVLAAGFVLLDGALAIALRLGIARQLFIASARMVIQLALVALVLATLFAHVSALWTGLAAAVMVLFAGREVMARQERRFAGLWSYGLGASCILVAATLVTVVALQTQLRPDPWYHPRYALPILGMVLGNAMTGVALGLNTLTTGAARERVAIEAQLALGAPMAEAMRPVARAAMRTALMPVINSMAAIGLVSLPGMMTGQILAGVSPAEAVKYQILVMFLIAGGTGLGAIAAVTLGALRLTDARQRLRLDRLAAPREP